MSQIPSESLQNGIFKSHDALSPKSVQLLHGHENPAPCDNFQLFEEELRLAGLLHLPADLFLLQRPVHRLLNSFPLDGNRNLSRQERQHSPLPRPQKKSSADAFPHLFFQVFPADPLKQRLISCRLPLSGLGRVLFVFQGHHVFPVPLPVITLMKSVSVVQIQQLLVILPAHLGLPVTAQIPVQILPVNFHHPGGILRFFHPALNFQGTDARLQNLRQQADRTHILRAQGVGTVPSVKPPVLLPYLVRQTAGLGTPSPVSASSADQAAHQALTGIAVAQGAVHKTLNFHMGGLPDGTDLLQGKLPGRNHPDGSRLLQKLRSLHTCDGHLGAGVDGKAGKILFDKPEYSQILHDHRVQPLPVQWRQITIQLLLKLLLL